MDRAAGTTSSTSTTATILSFVSNMVFNTPSVRAATLTEIIPAACPAANRLAALMVEINNEVGGREFMTTRRSAAAVPLPS
jgi:hypothetical protein